jgi:predicted enzyme related to lactoylglutathione lyase
MANQQKRPNFSEGDLCHFELPVKNKERAKAFYSKVFGWKFQDSAGNYTMITTPGQGIGGGLLSPSDDMPFKVTNYLFVNSIDAAAAKVKELGGKLLHQKTEVEGMGWMQHFEDPEGNLIALWQAKMKS